MSWVCVKTNNRKYDHAYITRQRLCNTQNLLMIYQLPMLPLKPEGLNATKTNISVIYIYIYKCLD